MLIAWLNHLFPCIHDVFDDSKKGLPVSQVYSTCSIATSTLPGVDGRRRVAFWPLEMPSLILPSLPWQSSVMMRRGPMTSSCKGVLPQDVLQQLKAINDCDLILRLCQDNPKEETASTGVGKEKKNILWQCSQRNQWSRAPHCVWSDRHPSSVGSRWPWEGCLQKNSQFWSRSCHT